MQAANVSAPIIPPIAAPRDTTAKIPIPLATEVSCVAFGHFSLLKLSLPPCSVSHSDRQGDVDTTCVPVGLFRNLHDERRLCGQR